MSAACALHSPVERPKFITLVCFTAHELALDKVHIINPKFVLNTHQPQLSRQKEKQAFVIGTASRGLKWSEALCCKGPP